MQTIYTYLDTLALLGRDPAAYIEYIGRDRLGEIHLLHSQEIPTTQHTFKITKVSQALAGDGLLESLPTSSTRWSLGPNGRLKLGQPCGCVDEGRLRCYLHRHPSPVSYAKVVLEGGCNCRSCHG